MPGKTARTVNQSRMAKHRIAVQQGIITEILNDSLIDITFGIVQKHNGNGQLQVLTPDKKESRAILRGLLGKCNINNAFPVGCIVVLGIRDFETTIKTLDVMAKLERKDVKTLIKMERLPEWMLSMADGSETQPGLESFEFDYEDSEEPLAQKNREKAKEAKKASPIKKEEEQELDIDAI